MTKVEFLERMEREKPLEGSGFSVVVGDLVDSPDIIGCYLENGIWRIYETKERGGHFVISETLDEDSAFDELYEQIYIQKKYNEL